MMHGSRAKEQVLGTIAFYRNLFLEVCSMEWADVLREAAEYIPHVQELCPDYLEEIQGIGLALQDDDSSITWLDVLAINVRTEIMFGLFTDRKKDDIPLDGCTSLGWKGANGDSFLAQNWDWFPAQKPNLIVVQVAEGKEGQPGFSMVTEAGLIGKIGMNTAGVGCCFNAIKARGVDRTRLPLHFALRVVLDSPSMEAAIEKLERIGVAGSGHILVGDGTGSTGLECTSLGIKKLQMDGAGRIVHTNHLLLDHPGIDEPPWLDDSPVRVARMNQLLAGASDSPTYEEIFEMFKDEEGYPGSINRTSEGVASAGTLFNIIMDLTHRKAWVKFGRTTESTGPSVMLGGD